MKLAEFRQLVEKAFDCIDDEVLRYTMREGTWQVFEETLSRQAFEEFLPQSKKKVAVVLDAPKTAALFFDRVCHIRDPYSVPSDIRVKVPTSIYLYDLFITSVLESSDALERLSEADFPDLPREELARQAGKAAINLADIIVPGFAQAPVDDSLLTQFPRVFFRNLLSIHSGALWHEYSIDAVPLYVSYASFDEAYREGDRSFLVVSFSNIGIVDEQRLEWEQVSEFRRDNKSVESVKRVVHWFDNSFLGKSRQFVEEDISIRLSDFAYALRKHGIKTVLGTISAVLDGKFMFGSITTSAGLAWLTNDPAIGFLTEGLLLSGKILVHLSETLLDMRDIRRASGSELAFIHDVRRKFGRPKTT